jgi:trk system potassium uptake protein TrkA
MKFCVIGIGRFGKQVATTLAENNADVLAIDEQESELVSIQNIVAQALCAKIHNKASLEAIGIEEVDVVIICIGENVAGSILVTALIKKHYPRIRIITRATNTIQQEILSTIGVDQVVRPEQETAIELADSLSSPFTNLCRIDHESSIALINAPDNWIGKSLESISLYQQYEINCVFIKNESNLVLAHENYVIAEGDKLIIAGKNITITDLM